MCMCKYQSLSHTQAASRHFKYVRPMYCAAVQLLQPCAPYWQDLYHCCRAHQRQIISLLIQGQRNTKAEQSHWKHTQAAGQLLSCERLSAALQDHGPYIYISMMGVHPDKQRQGLGGQLLKTVSLAMCCCLCRHYDHTCCMQTKGWLSCLYVKQHSAAHQDSALLSAVVVQKLSECTFVPKQ